MLDNKLLNGKNLLENGKSKEAFDELLPLAKNGIAEAEAIIGYMYFVGEGVDRDMKESVEWLKSAANKGRGEAAHNLGTLFQTCEPDMQRDDIESQRWFLKAKELGFNVG